MTAFVPLLRRNRSGAITLFSLLCLLLAAPALANPTMVVDVTTGRVLQHEQAFDRWYPASLTKLMTAYVTFEAVRNGELTMRSPVKMTANAVRQPPSKMGYGRDAVMNLENALKFLMVKSANDVAVAIAEAVGGTLPAFIERMNETAKRIGMTNSRFDNPHGLPNDSMYTTAHDLAVLALRLRRDYPEYAGVFGIEALSIGGKVLRNYNILLGRFVGADGMKTGYICNSGFNLVASATRNGRTLVAVVLGALDQQVRAEKAADLLAAGFAEMDEADKPMLASLEPYGDGQNETANIRGEICSGEAQLNRYDGRDVDGKLIFRSTAMAPMAREPVTVAAGLGDADGPPAANTFAVDIPLPQVRPADLQDRANLEPAGEMVERSTDAAPIPIEQPAAPAPAPAG